MELGNRQHLESQLLSAVLLRKDNTEVVVRNESGIVVSRIVRDLPRCQTAGTATQINSHASSLVKRYVNNDFPYLK